MSCIATPLVVPCGGRLFRGLPIFSVILTYVLFFFTLDQIINDLFIDKALDSSLILTLILTWTWTWTWTFLACPGAQIRRVSHCECQTTGAHINSDTNPSPAEKNQIEITETHLWHQRFFTCRCCDVDALSIIYDIVTWSSYVTELPYRRSGVT